MPLERTPRVKVVPEVVEALNLSLASVGSTELGDGLDVGETALANKDGAEYLAVLVGRNSLRVRDSVRDVPVDRVELPAALRVRELVERLLDALEETVVVVGLLVRVVAKDLTAVYLLAAC